MITYNNSQNRLRLVAIVALAAIGGGVYWWSGSDKHEGVVLSAADKAPSGWLQPTTGVASPEMALKPEVLSDGRPSDISADDWEVLKAVMAKLPNGQGQAERIVSFLRYQRTFETWQSIEDTADKQAKRRNTAKALLNELPERLSSGEFTLVESTLMAAVLIADIEPDEGSRNKALQQWQGKLNTVEPPTEDEAALLARSRPTELKRMQANAFMEWQAKTDPHERTSAKLEQAMLDVQRSFNSSTK
jgi:hypothetical protein